MLKSLYKFLSPKFSTLFLEYKIDMKPRYGHGLPPHGELYAIINEHREDYEKYIDQALALKDELQLIKQNGNEPDVNKPVWNNDFLPGLDIVMIYTLLVANNPKKYIEVGSGNSTKVTKLAKENHGLKTQIISIDPQPRAEIDHLADVVIRKPFENIDYQQVLDLEAGDILFIDNSHRILPNSDSNVFFLEILPKLKKGVIVHIHDIYVPYDYPQFMCDRFYSEQYGLAIYLLANPKRYQTIFPNYFVSEDPELSNRIAPMWAHENLKDVEKHGGSYWLRIAE